MMQETSLAVPVTSVQIRASNSPTRKKGRPLQEMLTLLPSWGWVRVLRRLLYRRILRDCGPRLEVGRDVIVEFPENTSVGADVFLNRGVMITARAPVQISDDVLIGPYVVLNSGNHAFARRDVPIRRQGHTSRPIVVERDVWIGAHAVVLGGVTIGEGSIVAAGAVVTKDVPRGVVVAGVPAVTVRVR